ncbi:MAG TPA: AraC family transcriptional regulator [Clostridiaceae bacterium]|nr:AraC family transcriptional regulator [Clostridiaceae bacterium]
MEPLRELVDMPDKSFPVRIFLRSSSEEHVFVHPHWHQEVEILYIIEGTATQQINEHIFSAVKGDIIVIGSDAVHSTYTQRDEDNKIIVLQFNADYFKSSSISSPTTGLIDDFSKYIDYPGSISDRTDIGKSAACCIKKIQDEFSKKERAFELLVEAHIFELMGILVRNFSPNVKTLKHPYQVKKAKEMLRNTFELIDNNYSFPLSLEQAAKASNLSISHFSRLFKRATGMTFKEYLSFYRINKAEEMLISSATYPISRIAFDCGFNSLASFIRAFKHYKKCTPSSYRNKIYPDRIG